MTSRRGRPPTNRPPPMGIKILFPPKVVKRIDRLADEEQEGVRARMVRALVLEALAARAAQ